MRECVFLRVSACCFRTHHVPVSVAWIFLTRLRAQAEAGSTRRRDGGRARSRAGLILRHTSWGSIDSRCGNDERAAGRSCAGSSIALDLTPMRIARRSRVVRMAWAVGEACSPSAAMKRCIVFS